MKIYAFSCLLVLIILISGCSYIPDLGNFGGNTGGSDSKMGLIIDTFEPVIMQKYSAEPVAFRVKIKNTGSETAFDVEARLTNIDEFQIYNQPTKRFQKIPPQTTTATGESPEVTWSWDLDAPVVPKGTKVTFKPRMQIIYTYKTDTVRSITVMPEIELREYVDSGKPFPSDVVSKSTGPVSLDIDIKGPIAHYQSKITFPISLTVQNIGGGTVCREECTDLDRDYNRVDLFLETYDVRLKDCELNNIRLTDDRATVVCNAEIDDSIFFGLIQMGTKQVTKKNIRFNIVYTYITDKVTTIEVVGK
ncbi:MAG: hypothetical protein JW716_03165 [Candidatus Aenigmarchaeota archaeon]|nr:hypothetical protein [Candidatus Aenigmarchaeota archaeon]